MTTTIGPTPLDIFLTVLSVGMAAGIMALLTSGKFSITSPPILWIFRQSVMWGKFHWSRALGGYVGLMASIVLMPHIGLERTPENALPALLISIGFILVGIKWLELLKCPWCQAFHYSMWPLLINGLTWWYGLTAWAVGSLIVTAHSGRLESSQ